MNDLISRQAAIEAIVSREAVYADDAIDILRSMPTTQSKPCEDAVSRQRLLSDLKELIAAWKKYPVMAERIEGVEAAVGYVELIPSVNPERKKGRWIKVHWKAFRCSECNRINEYFTDYCPNCGSYNGGDQ